jgi:hypothetical protein
LEDRLHAAEDLLSVLRGSRRQQQKHRIAGLKATLAKGYKNVMKATESLRPAG